ncbi:MAG: Mut7-C RNAse domain-containing protein [Actinomycetota bacterium]
MTRKSARFRFYAELNDFLPEDRRFVAFERRFELDASVKDMIEALGVPHTEVDLIVVNGRSVDWSHRVRDGDLVSVYPVFESFDISPVIRLRPEPLRDPRFVLDGHLGQLARYLRLLGFDTVYSNHVEDAELAGISVGQHRILLTRDVGLLKRRAITHGSFVRATDPEEQVVEVLQRFHLTSRVLPFTRCMNCNGRLIDVAKSEVIDQLEPDTATYYDEFRRCDACGRIYWKGSHYERLQGLIERVVRTG